MESNEVLQTKQKVGSLNLNTIRRIAGALIAFLIGSGFASGQEIFQFLTAYGYRGILGSVLSAFLFCAVSGILVSYGYRTKDDPNASPYFHYLGKFFGQFMRWYTPFFAFLITIVMISGTGATLEQYFGLDPAIGTVAMTIIITIVALLGLTKVVDVISLIGPFIIIFTLSIAVYTLITNPGDLAAADQILANAENVPFGAGNSRSFWLLASILFVAYNIVAAVPFMADLGAKEASNKKEAWVGGIVGGIGLMAAAFALNLAMLGHAGDLIGSQVPVLALAQNMNSVVSLLFVIVLVAGIFSTAAPMLLTVIDAITTKKTNKKTRNIFIVMTSLLALIGAQLPFDKLVGMVYPFTGYFGIAMIILFIGKEVMDRKKESN